MASGTTYYLIHGKTVGKREQRDGTWSDWLFVDGRWEPDTRCAVMDRLAGYDPFEPEDSPYRYGSMSVMDEMEEISEERALAMMGDQVVAFLAAKWQREFAEEKAAWDVDPGWPAKLVKTKFTLFGTERSIEPTDIGLTYDCWDQGFMEHMQGAIRRDLAAYGADPDRIYNLGFID